ncbi:ATP-binding cassette domain-containing protein [Albidovulum sediminicola]|uniref:ATP-binding cassette domain-containing protein n=1 Tax=Albidovulum sediminicola TaxID=2984331 RepID=A0ABT2YWK9_9RHOB|nr:ATP-binding cassette domain-containing protein [Defluviimonas sp. WL0075]MCV2863152.1 ATP-binding cassette domain-containing protein [Defluviimonas sp. WL0075]
MLVLEGATISQTDFHLRADLSVAAGERVAIIGPSGAGKSTLLAAIAGFVSLSGGRILWQGQNISGLHPGARPVSILFQDQNLFPHLTASENVGLGLRPDLRLTASDRSRVEAALERTGLGGFGARRPGALSGGQQSRVALARALLRDRPILLLDEPFAALGPALKAEMLDLVGTIAAQNGTTVLMVSHDPEDARRFAPRTILVADGQAFPPADTAALFNAPPAALAAYLGN